MAKLVDIYNSEKQHSLKRRQLPLVINDNLTMVMDLNSMGLICDNPGVKGREYEEFLAKYRTLTDEELRAALRVDCGDVLAVLNQSIPCVGCRRNVERLFYQLTTTGHNTLEPLQVRPGAVLSLRDDKLTDPHCLAALLHSHSTGMECVVEAQPRWKKSRRCVLHSLEAAGRGGCAGAVWAGWGARGAWRDAWDAMRAPCREHVALVTFSTLHDTLHTYLRKHRFCADCKTKVVRAYQLLTEERSPSAEPGYEAALYAGIRRCLHEQHLHLSPDTEFVAGLVARAELELVSSHRERHAKTLEIAQEEVLLCLGMCVYERLQRIWLRLREEESTCQTLAAVGVEALYRHFETAVERKTGVSKLQLLYDELTQEEISHRQRKQLKKLRKRKKKERQQGENKCEAAAVEGVAEAEREGATQEHCQCTDCIPAPPAPRAPSDCGYSSERHAHSCDTASGCSLPSSAASSPPGSDVACCDTCCDHHDAPFALSLQDMLSDTCSEEEEQDASYIPLEEVLAFRARRRNIAEERLELRQTLRNKFAQLCVNRSGRRD